MKKLIAITLTLVLAAAVPYASDGSPGLRHQSGFVVKKRLCSITVVQVSRETLVRSTLPSGEVGQMILNPESMTWRIPVFNDPYRYRSQKWIRDNNVEVKRTYFHLLNRGQLSPQLC